MHYEYSKILKKKVSKICFGSWSLGGATIKNPSYKKMTSKNCTSILNESIKIGINFFDTSPAYGNSEKILGKFLQNKKRENYVIATKIGCENFQLPLSFDLKDVKKQIKNSLKRLKTDYIDIIKFHSPSSLHEVKKSLSYLRFLKKKKIIRSIGVSLKNPLDYKKFSKLNFDFYQLNFNLIDQRALNLKKKNKENFIARTIFNFGFLTEEVLKRKNLKFDKYDHRSLWSKEQLLLWYKHSEIISKKFVSKDSNIKELSCRFVFSLKSMNYAVVGFTNLNDLKLFKSNKIFKKISKKKLKKLIEYYNNNTFFYKSSKRKTKLN